MKFSKKALSIFLSMLMVLSCISCSLFAFAADDPYAAFEAAVAANDLDSAIAELAKMDDDTKEGISFDLTRQFVVAVNTIYSTSTKQLPYWQQEEVQNALPKYLKDAMELAKYINQSNAKTAGGDKIAELWQSASVKSRRVINLFTSASNKNAYSSSSIVNYTYEDNKSYDPLIRVRAIFNNVASADGSTNIEAATKLLGSDSALVKMLNAATPALQSWFVDHKNDLSAPEFAENYEKAMAIYAQMNDEDQFYVQYLNFNQAFSYTDDKGKTQHLKSSQALYDSIVLMENSKYANDYFEALKKIAVPYDIESIKKAVELTNALSDEVKDKVTGEMTDLFNSIVLGGFKNELAKIDEPYDNADIVKAKDVYNLLPQSIQSSLKTLDGETYAKYAEILAAVSPSEAGDNSEDVAGQVIEYNAAKASSDNLGPASELFDAALKLVDVDLNSLIGENLLTNEMIGKIFAALQTLLTEKTAELPSFLQLTIKPSMYTDGILSDEYSAAVAKMADEASGDDSFANIKFESGDFFADGDADGFAHALAAMFRADLIVSVVPNILVDFENKKDTTKGEYVIGAYENLVPLFEMLGVEFLTSIEYTAKVEAAESAADKMEVRSYYAIEPIASLIKKVQNGGVDTLLEIVPNLAYALDSGLLNKQIGNILGSLKIKDLIEIKLDLTTDGLLELLLGEGKDLRKTIDETGLKISNEDLAKVIATIAKATDASSESSASLSGLYRMALTADKNLEKALITETVVEILSKDGNMDALIALLSGSSDSGDESSDDSDSSSVNSSDSLDLISKAIPVVVDYLKSSRANSKYLSSVLTSLGYGSYASAVSIIAVFARMMPSSTLNLLVRIILCLLRFVNVVKGMISPIIHK